MNEPDQNALSPEEVQHELGEIVKAAGHLGVELDAAEAQRKQVDDAAQQ